MLFNSYIFIFLFLPITLIIYYLLLIKSGNVWAKFFLVIASLLFYGWWNPIYLFVIIASLIFNYHVGVNLRRSKSKLLLFLGVSVNLSALVYYKYFNFFVDNLNIAFDLSYNVENIILPLAISFFTFQQVSYLIDVYKGNVQKYSILDYSLFVTFFPQLIAGPIVHHYEILPQFSNEKISLKIKNNLSIGITIFIFGLFKKVILADSISAYATPIFIMAESGQYLNFYTSWFGALSYSFQLYFDFSGYSDMAIGLALMFGVNLPINFHSPYKSINIIEFWRRWHITLSRFLRDYLYIPLGGNKKGETKRKVNLFITMLVGGIWHGSGWTFIIWGGYHGVLLTINHSWRKICKTKGNKMKYIYHFITFISVVVGWVVFRAESFQGAINMYSSMFDFYNISIPTLTEIKSNGLKNVILSLFQIEDLKKGFFILFSMLGIVFFSPNAIDIANGKSILNLRDKYIFIWKFTPFYAFILSVMSIACFIMMSAPSEFLYFQF